MRTPEKLLVPSKEGFAQDPFGYAAMGWHKWAMAQSIAGHDVDLEKGPTSEDLKSPILWLTHAHALSEAACILLRNTPELESMPIYVRGVSHCQYHATALMLLGYSLEVCLKALLIIKRGVTAYQGDEKKYFHHRLEDLAELVPELTEKDRAILTGLSHFVRWAGRYPDPGFGKLEQATNILDLSERHQICARDLFELAMRIMGHARAVI